MRVRELGEPTSSSVVTSNLTSPGDPIVERAKSA